MSRTPTALHRPLLTNLFAIACTSLLLFACGGGGGGGGGGSSGGVTGPTITQMGGARQGAALTLTGAVSTLASFTNPFGMTTDGTNLYVADSANNVIRKIVIATGATTVFAGTQGVSGSLDGAATTATFNAPAAVTTDGTNLYVADSGNNTIRKIVIANGVVSTLVAASGISFQRLWNPSGITTDGTNLYVADTYNHLIRKVVIATGAVTTLAGVSSASGGFADGTGTGAEFTGPYGISTDGTNLYIADTGNNAIRQLVIATNVVTTIAGAGPLSPGAVDNTGTLARFNSPKGITTDGTNLYVADTSNNTIRKIVISTGVVTTLAGNATLPAAVTNGTGTAAQFNAPYGVTTDSTRLFIGDSAGGTVRVMQ